MVLWSLRRALGKIGCGTDRTVLLCDRVMICYEALLR